MTDFTMSMFLSQDDMIAAMREHIEQLESQLESIGAGGVERLRSAELSACAYCGGATEALPTPKAEPEPVWDGKLHESLQRSLNALRLECPPELVNDCEFEVRKSFEALSTSLTTAKRMYGAARDRLEAIDASQPDPFAERVAQPAVEPVATGKWFTVVYKNVVPGDESALIGSHPKASALSWSHAMDDRDEALAKLAAAPNALDAETAIKNCLEAGETMRVLKRVVNLLLESRRNLGPEDHELRDRIDQLFRPDAAIAAQSAQGG